MLVPSTYALALLHVTGDIHVLVILETKCFSVGPSVFRGTDSPFLSRAFVIRTRRPKVT